MLHGFSLLGFTAFSTFFTLYLMKMQLQGNTTTYEG